MFQATAEKQSLKSQVKKGLSNIVSLGKGAASSSKQVITPVLTSQTDLSFF